MKPTTAARDGRGSDGRGSDGDGPDEDRPATDRPAPERPAPERPAPERGGDGTPDLKPLLSLALLPGIGPKTLQRLLDVFGSAEEVLAADPSDLSRVPGLRSGQVHAIRTAPDHVDPIEVIQWCRQRGVDIWSRDMPGYPQSLLRCVDGPPLLFVWGTIIERDEMAVAIVGTRHASPYGIKQAQVFSSQLSEAGITVVSGLARGIDTAAHRGALEAGGRTIAVLGGGLQHLYPPENQAIAESISRSGAVLSEFAPESKPRRGMFPQRNRLIAGLSLATLVVEAPERSGALITARLAMEQHRDVLAVPGPISSRVSRGCHQLIRDGAVLVQSVDDVLEAIGPLRQPIRNASGLEIRNGTELTLNEVEQAVLGAIDESGIIVDRLIEITGYPAHRVIAVISVLEMRRLVRRIAGNAVARL